MDESFDIVKFQHPPQMSRSVEDPTRAPTSSHRDVDMNVSNEELKETLARWPQKIRR